jgi:hypothetical protein
MERSLDRADKLLTDSRDKVKDLRPSASDGGTLDQALAVEGAQPGDDRGQAVVEREAQQAAGGDHHHRHDGRGDDAEPLFDDHRAGFYR